jgi:hypothetical protein
MQLTAILYLTNIELLGKLVEDRCITIAVFFNDRYNERNQFVPEIKTI